MATVGYALTEEVVATTDILFEQCHFLRIERTSHCAESSVLVSLHLVELHAQLFSEQSAEVGEHAEDANGAGDGCRLGDNVVGSAADVIAARGSIATHGDNDGLFGFEVGDGSPDLLRGIGRTARRVDAQHDSLHVVVVRQFLQILADGIGHDVVFGIRQAASLGVDDFAVGIIDGNLFALVFLAFHTFHISQCQLLDVVFLVNLQHLLDFAFHLVGIDQLVDHLHLDVVLGFSQRYESVGIGIQRIDGNLTAVGDFFQHDLPDAVDVGRHLFTVGLAHAVGSHHFGCALVFAHLAKLIFHAKLGQKVLHEIRRRGQSVPVNHAVRVQENLVGDTTYIIGGLLVGVGIGHNPLAALLEVEQGLADGVRRSRSVRREQAGLDVNTLDFFFVLSFFNGFQQLVQSHVFAHFSSQRGQRILSCSFVQRS